MRFGPVPVEAAEGLVSAHSVRAGDLAVRKGSRLDARAVAALREAGVASVIAAGLEPGDVGEDAAAGRVAAVLGGAGVRAEAPFTGRANLFATGAGVLVVERAAVDALNAVDEAVTVATLPALKPVVEGEMLATVKIIPYAVEGRVCEAAIAALGGRPPLRVAPYARAHVGVVSTLLPGLKSSVVEKTLRILGQRLAPTGAAILCDRRVPHAASAVADAVAACVAQGADLVIVFGASAIADRRDVIPAGIEAAGGTVAHFGMPVDPGNLLLVGALGDVPVIGAPGCARSPKENGFDWILHRLLADLPVSRADIVALGVGGLLMEIVSRPQPRSGNASVEEADEG